MIEPIGNYLVQELGHVVKQLDHVIVSTDDFLDRVRRAQIRPGARLRTMDVSNLYPSIERQHFMEKVTPLVRRFVSDWGKASLLIELMRVTLESSL
eukprot:7217782-Pyramimonas_sp.AAC.1